MPYEQAAVSAFYMSLLPEQAENAEETQSAPYEQQTESSQEWEFRNNRKDGANYSRRLFYLLRFGFGISLTPKRKSYNISVYYVL